MSRRFIEHHLRKVSTLDGIWDFAFLGDVHPDAVKPTEIVFNDRMAVPGCFDATPQYAGKRGLAAYRTRIFLEDDVPYRLTFNSVHHWCRVFVNGAALRDHAGGYTRFSAGIMEHPKGEVEIVVLVDNRFNFERSPLHLEYFDWYHFGGITRPVELHRLGDLWINSLRVTTDDIESRRITLALDYAATRPHTNIDLHIRWNDKFVLHEVIESIGTSGYMRHTFELSEAKLWSPREPNLQMIQVQLGQDDIRERIGIRQVKVEGRAIRINGEAVRLLGVNRHESHPQFGCALPEQIMVADVQQIKAMGGNFVRGSHYPQDSRFLDLCDEAGLCVWSESIGWQHTSSHLTDKRFLDAQMNHIHEMVNTAYNHPSVIMWGILNESDSSDSKNEKAYETLIGRIRQLDPTRPVTYASNHPFNDLFLNLVDIIAINTYPGWYIGEKDKVPELIDAIVKHLDDNGNAEKPLMISEIGADAIAGWRDWNETRWSEQYQAQFMEMVIQYMFKDRSRFCGLGIWQFCDGRTTEMLPTILGRPRGFNNKGIVDEYRRPKQAYNVIKRLFTELSKV